jgi:hypothetical protein
LCCFKIQQPLRCFSTIAIYVLTFCYRSGQRSSSPELFREYTATSPARSEISLEEVTDGPAAGVYAATTTAH